MRTILFLLACTQAALVVLVAIAVTGCGGGGDAYTPVVVAAEPDPKACAVALVKLDGGQASCTPETKP